MVAFSLKLYFEDILQQLRCNKRRLLVCILCVVLGIVLGIVLYNASNCNWWYCNRYNYVYKILYGGFFEVLCSFVIGAVACGFWLCLFSLWRWTHFLCFPLLLVSSLYFGAHCCAIFSCAGMLGILHLILVLAVGQVVNMLCCFLTICTPPCRRTFKEAFHDLKSILLLLLASVILRIIVIFLLLRFLSSAV